jgi:enoyl-CoA hydratase/carnithine racemase
MTSFGTYGDIGVELDNHVAVVEIQRPPHNFFNQALIASIGDAFDALDADSNCRAIVFAAQGKSFCAGADFNADDPNDGAGDNDGDQPLSAGHLYKQAVRLFSNTKPIVGAIQGAAIGGGMGLSMVPDFRVTCPEARFSANFTKLGFHPGFGLTETLPALIGQQNAAMLFYTGRRIKGDEAVQMGLADVLVPQDQLRDKAIELAAEIAESSPLGVTATRATLRRGLAERIAGATDRELAQQDRLRETEDFAEGVKAVSERRPANFKGR